MRLTWVAAATILISAHANAGIEQQITDCSVVSDKLDRLICYDSLAQQLNNSNTSGKSNTVAPAAVLAPVTGASSQTTTVEEEFGNVKKAEAVEVERIYLEISKVSKNAYGDLTITFTNGQVWKQTESTRYKLQVNQNVFIEKAAFGSFVLGSDDRNSTIRVKRLK